MLKTNFNKKFLGLVIAVFLLMTTQAFSKAPYDPLSTAIEQLTTTTTSGDITNVSFQIGNLVSYNYTSTPDYITCETSAYIIAKIGGVIRIGNGMMLIVPPRALTQNTKITVHFEWYPNYIDFVFLPSPMTFLKPLLLFIPWSELNKMGLFYNPTLYYDDGIGTPVRCEISDLGITYYLEHFSIYYFVRR